MSNGMLNDPYVDKEATPTKEEDHWKMIATRYEMALEAIILSASNSNSYLSTIKAIAEAAMGKEKKK